MRSWNWNGNDDVCAPGTWSVGAPGTVSLVTETFSSCEVGCGATWGEVGAFCVEVTVYEGEGVSLEPTRQRW